MIRPSIIFLSVFTMLLDQPCTTADIISTTGATSEIGIPASVLPGALESNTQIFIFRERTSTALTSNLALDVSQPATVTSGVASPGTVLAGNLIDSYYVHFDKVGTALTFASAGGSVTFDQEVLGLIIFNDNLNLSDFVLGAQGTLYPTFGSSRGIILEQGSDSVTLTADRRTVSFSLQTAQFGDSIRIITAVPEPSGLLASCLAIAICLTRRQRRML